MAILQSNVAKGERVAPQAFVAGTVVAQRASIAFPDGVDPAATDLIELAVLPAGYRMVDAKIIPTGDFDGATAKIGIMSGTVGDVDDASRTVGNEFGAAVALTALAPIIPATALAIEAKDSDRSIGLQFSNAVTGAGQSIEVLLLMAAV